MSARLEFCAGMIGDNFFLGLIESLRFAVPLEIIELSHKHPQGVPRWELDRAIPNIGTYATSLMFTDSKPGQSRAPARTSHQLNSFGLAHNALVRGLAAMALATPGGVTFAGLHWCTADHEDCPNPPKEQAQPVADDEIVRVVGMLTEFREVCGLPPARPRTAVSGDCQRKPKPVQMPAEEAPRHPLGEAS